MNMIYPLVNSQFAIETGPFVVDSWKSGDFPEQTLENTSHEMS